MSEPVDEHEAGMCRCAPATVTEVSATMAARPAPVGVEPRGMLRPRQQKAREERVVERQCVVEHEVRRRVIAHERRIARHDGSRESPQKSTRCVTVPSVPSASRSVFPARGAVDRGRAYRGLEPRAALPVLVPESNDDGVGRGADVHLASGAPVIESECSGLSRRPTCGRKQERDE